MDTSWKVELNLKLRVAVSPPKLCGTANRVRSERVPERVPGSGRSERERNSRYGVAQAMVVKVRMRLRNPIFVCVILKGASSLPMCGKDQVA